MKICIIPSSYPNENGIGNIFVEQLVNEFARLGHLCTVISPLNIFYNPDNASIYKEYEQRKVDNKYIINIFRPRIKMLNIPCIKISTTRYATQKVIEETINKNKFKFDCIYCHFFASAICAWHYVHNHKIPLFVATGESSIKSKLQYPCFGFSWDKFKADTKGVICVSTKNYNECVSLGYASIEKCKIFPNGVNNKIFKKLDKEICRKSLNINNNDFIVIAVGEFSDRKGQNRIIKAIDKLNINNIKAMFIGNGQELPYKSYIIHKGQIPHEELPIYLNASDIFVLPTLREGCCNAIIEALACGLPIVSSDRKFNYDILDKKNSILVDPENIENIAEAIKYLHDNKEYREILSRGALDSSTKLSINERAKNIISFIQKCINNE